MASAVDIANRALQKLGAKSIVSLTQDDKSAREMNRAYEPLRDAELEVHPWAFAKTRVTLPELSDAPAFGFAAQYQLPSDFISVYRRKDDPEWQIEGGKVLTDQTGGLNLIYIRRVTDVNAMSPLFREALAARLAYDLAESFTQSTSKKEAAAAMYDFAIKQARQRNAILNPAEELPTSGWLNTRL